VGGKGERTETPKGSNPGPWEANERHAFLEKLAPAVVFRGFLLGDNKIMCKFAANSIKEEPYPLPRGTKTNVIT